MTTIVPGPNIPRSPGSTWDIPGCPKDIPRSPGTTQDNLGGPTTHDYYSYRSKEVLGQLSISRDVLPDTTTIVPGSKIPRSPGITCEILGCPKDILRSPGTTRDIQGCPTRHDYQSPRSKRSQEVLGQLGTSRDALPHMTTIVPGPKDPKKSWDNLGHPGMPYHT